MNGNNLYELPEGFGALECIVELHLDENHITHLPQDFGGLKLLEILDLGTRTGVYHALNDNTH